MSETNFMGVMLSAVAIAIGSIGLVPVADVAEASIIDELIEIANNQTDRSCIPGVFTVEVEWLCASVTVGRSGTVTTTCSGSEATGAIEFSLSCTSRYYGDWSKPDCEATCGKVWTGAPNTGDTETATAWACALEFLTNAGCTPPATKTV